MKIPIDNKLMTEKYLIDKGGICGQACLAVIEGVTIQDVLNNWGYMGLSFKGWSGWKQLRDYLEKKGFNVKLKRKEIVEDFDYNKFYILRVQWIGEGDKQNKPFYGWGHWIEASAHTHFIVIHKEKLFCNEEGELLLADGLEFYLKHFNGVVTSAMEIYK